MSLNYLKEGGKLLKLNFNMAMARRVFISFLNDDDCKQETYCELIQESENFVKVMIGQNLITIPYHRLLKMKEAQHGY